MDQKKLRGSLDACKAVAVTIDGRAAVDKGEAFYAMRKQLQEAVKSGEQKACVLFALLWTRLRTITPPRG